MQLWRRAGREPSANRREGCNTPLVRGQREPLDGADAATMTLDHLGAKMRCDKCGNWPLLTKFGAVIEVLG
jgi:hypothetical protein